MERMPDDDQAQRQAFRDRYEAVVYTQAQMLTQDDRTAARLTDRVFEAAYARFPDGAFPTDYRCRLLADVYLAFSGMSAEAPAPRPKRQEAPAAQAAAVVPALPTAVEKALAEAQIVPKALARQPAMPSQEEPAPPAPREPAEGAAPPHPRVYRKRVSAMPPADYDAGVTELWVPDVPAALPPRRSAPPVPRPETPEVPAVSERSIPHTVVNTALLLACVAAGVAFIWRSGLLNGLL